MGLAANIVAKLVQRYHWIAWIGLVVILYVALKMLYEGWTDPTLGIGTLFT
jgi:predicted tellurium resistance membrane protein TerC